MQYSNEIGWNKCAVSQFKSPWKTSHQKTYTLQMMLCVYSHLCCDKQLIGISFYDELHKETFSKIALFAMHLVADEGVAIDNTHALFSMLYMF